MRKGLFRLNNNQWALIEPHLPTKQTDPARDDARRILSGIIHMLSGPTLARLPARLSSLHDDLQSLQSVGQARLLAGDL